MSDDAPQPPEDAPIIVLCECCGSEGRIYRRASWLDSDAGPGEIDDGPCEACDGTGREMIEGEPITMEDLDEAHAPAV